ncbi:flagellar biosynthesis protein FlgL [Desulfovibrio sp. OttesenSCG-928-C06]|nr:flagellar biosynthesis protein FlgL [Desulfovibrio sp. OttesenSCG-928-C06]
MALRISQRMIYSNMSYGMNNTLSGLMNLHEQNTTQKKVNRPADDPYATAQIMQSRNTLASISQYTDNLNMAKGWISSCDSTLELVQEQLVDLQTILQQGATGHLSEDQRRDLGFRAQSILDQIINLSNTQFGGRHIFSGHKTDASAYTRALGAFSKDSNLDGVSYRATGDTSSTVLIQVDQSVPAGTPITDLATGAYTPPFRYSNDGGNTWQDGTCALVNGNVVFNAGAVKLEAIDASGTAVVGGVDPDNAKATDNGTWIYVSPTAQYQGDTKGVNIVQQYPPIPGSFTGGQAYGNFSKDTAVRLDNVSGTTVEYSYSIDNGATWTSAKVPLGTAPQPSTLYIPGGYLDLDSVTAADVGKQLIVKPYSADIELSIGSNASIVVNNVGLDVFGGLFQAPFDEASGPQPVNGYGKDLFGLVSKAIAALETNSQEGCQQALGELEGTMEYVLGYRTQAGSRANRVTSIENQLEFLKYDEEGRLSTIEDADLSELLSKLSQQQLAYNSVLKSSSMIMQLSLMNFL